MAIYTTVDDDYNVWVYKSFNKLWDAIKSDFTDAYHFPYGEHNEELTPLTKKSLQIELQTYSVARIYDEDETSWLLKIELHKYVK
jgi:hypothetical protein